jgi:nickel transport protein
MGSCRSTFVAATLLLAPALAAWPARAHETLHEVARGRAVAVRAFFADGEALAYRAYEVYSPADPRITHQKGRTDRVGWLAFVPDVPGKWRVKVVDDSGHGLDVEVESSGPVGAAAPASGGGAVSIAAFVLRPLVGLLAIGAVFSALFLAYRRKGGAP